MFLFLPIINQLQFISGWLEIEEADLLMSAALNACFSLPSPHNIVEVGSYHGKSTVLLGYVVKHFSPQSKVFAIDPHEGNVGSSDTKFYTLPPSLTAFKKNVSESGLIDIVNLIQDYSFNVKLKDEISLLFIDGLHDYQNVSRDFHHFVSSLRVLGFIAFHDYSDFYPGVVQFVNELLVGDKYSLICRVKSLVVLRKNK